MPDGSMMAGPPMGVGAGPPAGNTPPFTDRVRAIIEQVRALAEEGGVTEQERLQVEKITTLVQQLAAGREKEDQALVGGGPATNALARAYGS
jgi:hypothetical protein